MAPIRAHLMRALRLQLKTGFIRNEPPEYLFMKRYPPIARDSKKPSYHKLEYKNIPYLDLLKKAMDRNPLYEERVYPAYWQQEPLALVLAKKQYAFMNAGDDEETAFRKAEVYIGEIENKSFLTLKALHEAIDKAGAKALLKTNESILAEIELWKEKLQGISYDDLDLADQGEIDHLIQTKVLKWNEIERERRMKDAIFTEEFDNLRAVLLTNKEDTEIHGSVDWMDIRKQYFGDLVLHADALTTSKPFYLEDYVSYFSMLNAQPDLRRWKTSDCEQLSRWIIDTVAFQERLEFRSTDRVKNYLCLLQNQYFPMTLYPDKTASYQTPTIDSLKKLLYENDVGYETRNGKVFVKRQYKIPGLLFPLENLVTQIAEGDTNHLGNILTNQKDGSSIEEEEAALLKEMAEVGLNESSLPQLKKQLKFYLKGLNNRMSIPDYTSNRDSNGRKADMSALDNLLRDAFDDQAPPATTNSRVTVKGSTGIQGGDSSDDDNSDSDVSDEDHGFGDDSSSDGSSTSGSDDEDDDRVRRFADENIEEEDDGGKLAGEKSKKEKRRRPLNYDKGPDAVKARHYFDSRPDTYYTDAEWDKLVAQYKNPAITELEQQRDEVFGEAEMDFFKNAKYVADLQAFQQMRRENEIIARSKMESIYVEKEAARLEREWKRREVMEMPKPTVIFDTN